jgi:hypothetical protein
MNLRNLLVAASAVTALHSAHAVDVVLAETFNNVAALPAAGWVFTNNSPSPGLSWAQGLPYIFEAAAGPADSYAYAGFLSTTAVSGPVSNWLLTPTLTLTTGSELVFFVRNAGEGFLDKLEVRFSANGSSTNVGASASSVGDFSVLLKSYSSSSDNGWLGLTYTFSSLAGPTSGRIGFRYIVGDVATDGNYLGIDSVVVTGVLTPVPEPTAALMLALGLSGLWFVRRRG